MKELFALLLVLCMLLLTLVACAPAGTTPDAGGNEGGDAPAEKLTIRAAGMKGPTSLGLVKLMEDNAAGTSQNKYEFNIYTKADEITPKLIKGELDMAALPANAAATVYGKTDGAITVLAVNTLGVVYVVEKGDSVQSLTDLAGKKIYAVGKGTTPEYGLSYILSQNGMSISDLDIEWKNEATEILPLLKAQENAIAMIPQPFVTAAQVQVEGLRVALSLNEEWNKLNNGSQFITGVLVARTEFVEKNPEAVAAFLAEYEASINYAKTETDAAAELVVKYGIMDAVPLAKKALPNCNLAFLAGADMKTALTGYLTTLYNQNPQSIGGSLPADGFYYVKE
ncbi:MAG: ABC transporter substrate-binding protein [Clostridia bacterium]|nr:ABC transporter substrate-binding protein [Clostridia bacterium]